MEQKKLMAIKRMIACAVDTEEEAQSVISLLTQENWAWWIENTHPQHRLKNVPCVLCKTVYLSQEGPLSGLCSNCQPLGSSEVANLTGQRNRAKKAGVPYTLTLREWFSTIEYFQMRCAYCLAQPYTVIEHFIPIATGGGTTKDNCVPACPRCNKRKSGYPTDKLKNRFPPGTIDHVISFLQQFHAVAW